MNMKILYGLIGICVVLISALGFLSAGQVKYNVEYGEQGNITAFNKTFEKIEKLHNQTEQTYNDLYERSIEFSVFDVVYGAVKLGVDSAKMLWSSISILTTMVSEGFTALAKQGITIPEEQGATGWLVMSILSIIFTSAIIWFISLLLKWKVGGD